jgi:Transposase DDE domain
MAVTSWLLTITNLYVVCFMCGRHDIRTDLLGVSSIVRALGLDEKYYTCLIDNFHSSAIKLDKMTTLWTRLVLKLFSNPVMFNGRFVLVGDGLKVGKEGKKMPAVKSLHQESESNTKPEYIMGHSFQAISLLVRADKSVFATPLMARIHEGVIFSNRDKRTLLDKMIHLLNTLEFDKPHYFLADAYYASGKIIKGVFDQGNHLVTRAKSNAVAYEQHQPKEKKGRGRPKKYGKKTTLKSLFKQQGDWETSESPVYGEKDINITYQAYDLLWKPAGRKVRFVAVVHPKRGRCLLMSTDVTLSALDIIELYGLRFKIEHAFKQSIHIVGTFTYHFWMKAMKPLRRRNGNQYPHHETQEYRNKIKQKIHAYHVFVFTGVVAQGLLQYLSSSYTQLVWSSFGSWLRNSYPEFLLGNPENSNLLKFIAKRLSTTRAGPLAYGYG